MLLPETCSQTAMLWRRPHCAERSTEAAGSWDLLGKSPGGLAEFPPFHNDPPSLEGAAAQGAKDNSSQDGGHRAAPPTARSPVPARNPARRPRAATGPTWAENANPFQEAESAAPRRGGRAVTPKTLGPAASVPVPTCPG